MSWSGQAELLGAGWRPPSPRLRRDKEGGTTGAEPAEWKRSQRRASGG